MKTRQSGFTLIELVMVIVILGILAAMAVPRFVDLQSEALTAAQNGMVGAVRAAHAVAIADLRTFPRVDQLAGYVQGGSATAVATGIQVTINGNNYIVLTYDDTACSNATANTSTLVRCVGSM